MIDTRVDVARAAFRRSLAPPPVLSVSQWLDKHRVLPRGYVSPFPGPWRTDRAPYLREPLDSFNDPDVEELVIKFASQIGKTEMLLGTLLYAYGADAAPGMMVFPRIEDASGYSSKRLAPTLRSCALVKAGRATRRTEDSKRSKIINGFPLKLGGANSAAGLASDPVQYLWCDEVDRWPAELPNEGDPLVLARQRTAAFARRRILLASTPTVKHASRIEERYEASDRRVLMLPCPGCGEFFEPKWSDVKWDRADDGRHLTDTARLEHACGHRVAAGERATMVAAGRWRATNPSPAPRVRGYYTWAVACPWISLDQLALEFVNAQTAGKHKLQEFINLRLGQAWEEQSLRVESSELMSRREEYPAEVPAGAAVLTAGVDTQDDRLELIVVGWGPGEESWVVARETVPGDPDREDTWKELDVHIRRGWRHELGGTIRIQATLVDCLGHRTGAVYRALKPRQSWRMFASVGRSGGKGGQIVTRPEPMATTVGNVLRCIVDADQVKALIYSRLALADDDGMPRVSGPGVIHFPAGVGDAFFTELTAEHRVTERTRGFSKQVWRPRPGVYRNETLDCFGMALAALRAICPSEERFDELAARVDAARGADAPARPGDKPTAGPLDASRSRRRLEDFNA